MPNVKCLTQCLNAVPDKITKLEPQISASLDQGYRRIWSHLHHRPRSILVISSSTLYWEGKVPKKKKKKKKHRAGVYLQPTGETIPLHRRR
ncbi:hypothetical protein K445DRAFT_111090 [Daldinia sp. EC12]|nr:hypothetical protein K445DRAFT_111090 [Daldinia sp. EC12]